MGHNAFQMSTWSAKGNGTDTSLFYLLFPFWQYKKNQSHLLFAGKHELFASPPFTKLKMLNVPQTKLMNFFM